VSVAASKQVAAVECCRSVVPSATARVTRFYCLQFGGFAEQQCAALRWQEAGKLTVVPSSLGRQGEESSSSGSRQLYTTADSTHQQGGLHVHFLVNHSARDFAEGRRHLWCDVGEHRVSLGQSRWTSKQVMCAEHFQCRRGRGYFRAERSRVGRASARCAHPMCPAAPSYVRSRTACCAHDCRGAACS
jgi:hypothetical protein